LKREHKMTDVKRHILDRSRPHFSNSRHLILAVSELCNHRCVYCYVSSSHLENRSVIPVAKLIEHFIALRESLNVNLVTLVGGEPSLLHDFEEVVRCIRYTGLDLIVQSNGSLRPDQIAVLKEVEVRYVSVSLDSTLTATNDALRFSGATNLAQVCIRRCVESNLPVRISCVVTRSNLGHIPALVKYAEESGVDLINLHYVDTIQNPSLLRNVALSAEEWLSAWNTWKQLASDSTVLIRAPIVYLPNILAAQLANAGVACPARQSDTINMTPDERLFRCPLLMAIDKPSWYHSSDIKCSEPLDDMVLMPVSSRSGSCPVLARRQDEIDSADYVRVCPMVKSTLNTSNGTRNPLWDQVIGLTDERESLI